ncbi:helix-turn-helix domain-containing protein [Micromonospora rubida]
MVLLAAEGLPNAEIARRVGTTRQTVIGWRARYVTGGIDALSGPTPPTRSSPRPTVKRTQTRDTSASF